MVRRQYPRQLQKEIMQMNASSYMIDSDDGDQSIAAARRRPQQQQQARLVFKYETRNTYK